MSKSAWGDLETKYFFDLTPEATLDAIESIGFKASGRVLTLNSMENRVYEVEIDRSPIADDHGDFIIAKFYRPNRWTEQQIRDEHQFLLDLDADEIPVIAPLKVSGETLFDCHKTSLKFALFPKKGGRSPQEMSDEDLSILGRQLARLHNTGKLRVAEHRLSINPEIYGRQNLDYLLTSQSIPMHVEGEYKKLVNNLVELIDPMFKNIQIQRIHGDCHLGNIIHRPDEGFFFIDFDDMVMGPPVQDIWLIIPGRDHEAIRQRSVLLEAYDSMGSFDYSTLKLIEPLRSLRYIHFTAWIAKRWNDPSFKNAFPFFGQESYWQEQTRDLHSQISIIGERND